jgi:hypothetical protein
MRELGIAAFALASSAALTALGVGNEALAQQGHPLVGTWSGYWQSAGERSRVLLLLDYDGVSITGVIDPGRNPAPLTRAYLDPKAWTVILEGSRSDSSGEIVHIVIEGHIENLTSATQRAIIGTWTQGDTHGDLRVTLN